MSSHIGAARLGKLATMPHGCSRVGMVGNCMVGEGRWGGGVNIVVSWEKGKSPCLPCHWVGWEGLVVAVATAMLLKAGLPHRCTGHNATPSCMPGHTQMHFLLPASPLQNACCKIHIYTLFAPLPHALGRRNREGRRTCSQSSSLREVGRRGEECVIQKGNQLPDVLRVGAGKLPAPLARQCSKETARPIFQTAHRSRRRDFLEAVGAGWWMPLVAGSLCMSYTAMLKKVSQPP